MKTNVPPAEHGAAPAAAGVRSLLHSKAWAALRVRLSIRHKILLALLMVVLLMSAPYFFLIVPGLQYKQQYDAIIENITTANSINNDNGSVKQQIDAEMWAIIAGKKPFTQGNQYTILDDVGMRVQQMIANTESQKGKLKLQVIQRTLQTLRQLIDQVGVQIAANKTFDDNMALMAQIRIVSQLVEDNVQGYALFEVSHTQQQYLAMQSSLSRWGLGCLAAIIAAVLFSIAASWRISKGIYVPIKKLHDVTTTLAREDLEVLVTADNADEITELGISFNRMVGRVRELLAAKISEQEHLKKAELRALQAQINPHFLYNTLDTIIWMAESNQKAQVIALVRALSRFFRITLSKGRDWITVREEVEHIESYLTIQKMRYHDILDYKIDMQADISMVQILKLTLQPLVENALYHGIKNKRSGGVIAVRGRRIGADQLLIEVEDNGIGMAPEKLAQLRASLDHEGGRALVIENGYGINNVNQRIKLYYGQEYGVTIESERGRGTRVALVIPIHTVPTHYPLPMSAGY